MVATRRSRRPLGARGGAAGDGEEMPASPKRQKDDVEYDITFPTPGKCCSDLSAAGKEPVVYLLGWAGCKHRHLSKYGTIYEEQGCITVKYIAPPKYFFQPRMFSGNVLEDHAFTLVNLIEDFKLEEHPLFFHVFSNGGAFVYSLMSRQFQDRDDIVSKIRGVVFDSGPARVTFWTHVRVMASLIPGHAVVRYAVSVLHALATRAISVLHSVADFLLGGGALRRWPAYDALIDEPPLCPQLFLYSKADDVCPEESVREFAEKRRDRGVQVEQVVWSSSPHVQHLVMYREEYTRSVVDFVRRCLSGTIATGSTDKALP